MPTLQIQLLGTFHLRADGEPVTTISQARLQSLLAYLLLHGNVPLSRQQIAFTFWPESSDAQAQANLRQLLHSLRRKLPGADDCLEITASAVSWRSDAPATLDVAEFQAALDRAVHTDGPARAEALEQAVARYGGDLLPNCYDDWILPKRERLAQQFINALEQLMQILAEGREYSAAIAHAQRLLRYDPLHEATYRSLMQLLAATGDRAAALRVYHTCVTTLMRELSVEPAAATHELYERLLQAEPAPPLASARASEASFVGRRSEWQHLQRLWNGVRRGGPHSVCLVGEAGIGKTRLAEEMMHWAQRQGVFVVHTRAYGAEGELAYAPLVEALRSETLRPLLSRLDRVWQMELARIQPELLSADPYLPRPEPITERWHRQRLFEALARVFLAAARPTLFVIDDLQWCDAETLEWLHYLLRYDRRASLLVIGTLRPEELAPGHPTTHLLLALRSGTAYSEFELARLDAAETAELAGNVAGRTLAQSLAGQIYDATEGNPFFIVETVRASMGTSLSDFAGADQEPETLAIQMLPPRVHAMLQARLRQLSPPAQQLASYAAVIGRQFTYDVLTAACEQDEHAIVRGLDELWQRRLIREQGANAYDFSHDRIRDVVYAEIGPARRRLLHRRVAQGLERLHGENRDVVCGQLAVHHEQAGGTAQAIAYFGRAATLAHHLGAYPEALAHLNKRLALLASLPASSDQIEQQVDTLLRVGSMLIVVKAFTALEVKEVYEQARELCRHIEHVEKRFLVLRGLRLYWGQCCQLQISAELEKELLLLAQTTQNPIHLQEALRLTGSTLLHRGHFREALGYFERAVALSDAQQHTTYTFDYEHDPGITNLQRLAATLWFLGYPEQAQTRMDEALAKSRSFSHPFDRLITLGFAFELAHCMHQLPKAQSLLEEHATLSAKHPVPQLLASEKLYGGLLLAHQGETEAGLALLRQGRDEYRQMGVLLFCSQYFSFLAEACLQANQFEEGLAVLADIVTSMEETGEQYWSAEIYRLRGELLLVQGAAAREVERCYQHALEIARRQGALSLELRAAINLARLWQRQPRREQARSLLSEIYARFTEGFDTTDLRHAQTLLESLDAV